MSWSPLNTKSNLNLVLIVPTLPLQRPHFSAYLCYCIPVKYWCRLSNTFWHNHISGKLKIALKWQEYGRCYEIVRFYVHVCWRLFWCHFSVSVVHLLSSYTVLQYFAIFKPWQISLNSFGKNMIKSLCDNIDTFLIITLALKQIIKMFLITTILITKWFFSLFKKNVIYNWNRTVQCQTLQNKSENDCSHHHDHGCSL